MEEKIKDIKKFVEYLQLRQFEEKPLRSREIHLYFKTKYGIRLFETNNVDVIDKIIKKN